MMLAPSHAKENETQRFSDHARNFTVENDF
jgi:hypothetical protein